MPLKSDHVDCTDFTDTIINRAKKLAANAAAGDVIEVTYDHPTPAEAYEMIAMSLRIKALATHNVRYEQTLHGVHTFTVLTSPH